MATHWRLLVAMVTANRDWTSWTLFAMLEINNESFLTVRGLCVISVCLCDLCVDFELGFFTSKPEPRSTGFTSKNLIKSFGVMDGIFTSASYDGH